MSDPTLEQYADTWVKLHLLHYGLYKSDVPPDTYEAMKRTTACKIYVLGRASGDLGRAILDALIADWRRVYGLFRR